MITTAWTNCKETEKIVWKENFQQETEVRVIVIYLTVTLAGAWLAACPALCSLSHSAQQTHNLECNSENTVNPKFIYFSSALCSYIVNLMSMQFTDENMADFFYKSQKKTEGKNNDFWISKIIYVYFK